MDEFCCWISWCLTVLESDTLMSSYGIKWMVGSEGGFLSNTDARVRRTLSRARSSGWYLISYTIVETRWVEFPNQIFLLISRKQQRWCVCWYLLPVPLVCHRYFVSLRIYWLWSYCLWGWLIGRKFPLYLVQDSSKRWLLVISKLVGAWTRCWYTWWSQYWLDGAWMIFCMRAKTCLSRLWSW